MSGEELKEQLLCSIEEIIKIILKGNTAEIKTNKDGVLILEVKKRKI